MTDEASAEGKWRKHQIRMHALTMAVESAKLGKSVDIVKRAIAFEDFIFRGAGTTSPREAQQTDEGTA